MKSDFIFDLALKHDILFEKEQFEFLDEQYEAFKSEYVKLAGARDQKLLKYLAKDSKIFRTLLPWRNSLYDTMQQTVWYYDETISYDPIFVSLNYEGEHFEQKKKSLVELLKALKRIQPSIDAGYVLFICYKSLKSPSLEEPKIKYDELISNASIRLELDKLVDVLKDFNSDNGKDNYVIWARYRGQESFIPVITNFEEAKGGVNLFTEESKYKRLSYDEVQSLGLGGRVYDSFTNYYHQEINETLKYIPIGRAINTPVQFDRELDSLLLKQMAGSIDLVESPAKLFKELTLPSLNGIPPQALMDLRVAMPNAFLDFRSYMAELISDINKNESSKELVEIKINNKIRPLVKKLESEMKHSVDKMKLVSLGVPLAAVFATWGMHHFGIDLNGLSPFLSGGLTMSANGKAYLDYKKEQREISDNPLYFLWKVKQGK